MSRSKILTLRVLLRRKNGLLAARWRDAEDMAKRKWLRPLGKNGLEHSRSVERYLDSLFPNQVKRNMSGAEILVLLYATYLHDIGRIFCGGEGHERASYDEIVRNIGEYKLNNRFEARAVAEVSYGHAARKRSPSSRPVAVSGSTALMLTSLSIFNSWRLHYAWQMRLTTPSRG